MFFRSQVFPTEKSQILSGFFWFSKKAKGVQKKPEIQNLASNKPNWHPCPQPLQPGSTAGAMYFREADYDDIICLDYRKKTAVRTALENLMKEESYADGKDEHFATLERSCVPKRKPLRPWLGILRSGGSQLAFLVRLQPLKKNSFRTVTKQAELNITSILFNGITLAPPEARLEHSGGEHRHNPINCCLK